MSGNGSNYVKQVSLKTANAFVSKHHRHHGRVVGHKLSIGLFRQSGDGETYVAKPDCEDLLGVAIIGRPSGRFLDDGATLEITRLAVVEGLSNGCSQLYGAASRIVKDLGYRKIITYILQTELGTSLRAAGWILEDGDCGGESWNSSGKMIRTDEVADLFGTKKKYPNVKKQRWARCLHRYDFDK